ncbi:MAG: tRNA (adenosine(37)-N6)-threonylcarbamoyltransferase complex ATPase subunit type 1 TsaE, partial [Oscillospiraceae bacterium]|nr:tRNA (adenosine(37)-N6)-threonylcarbamoyltransferase complex ATPase subunit type 1 TsaE [Oscillospiraceae bacterium]
MSSKFPVTHITSSPEQTERIGLEFGKTLKSGDVIAYFGGMGAGKTAFTRGL